jgi:type VI secretion system secreted protein Hcp
MKTRQSSSTRKAIQIVLATGVAVGAAQAQAATDMFLNITGLPGESLDKTHKGEIELVSYSQAVDSKGCTVTISKYVDKTTPGLTAAALSRSSFSSMVLTARKAGGSAAPVEYYKITMDSVTVLSADQSVSESDPEQVVLSPKSMILSYRPQKQDGSLDAAVESTVNCSNSNGSGGGGGGGGRGG